MSQVFGQLSAALLADPEFRKRARQMHPESLKLVEGMRCRLLSDGTFDRFSKIAVRLMEAGPKHEGVANWLRKQSDGQIVEALYMGVLGHMVCVETELLKP